MPVTDTYYKTHYGKKHLSVHAKRKTGGTFSLLVQELDDKGALLWIRKERFYRGQQVTGGRDTTIVWNCYDSFSEAVRYGKNYLSNLIGGNKKRIIK